MKVDAMNVVPLTFRQEILRKRIAQLERAHEAAQVTASEIQEVLDSFYFSYPELREEVEEARTRLEIEKTGI